MRLEHSQQRRIHDNRWNIHELTDRELATVIDALDNVPADPKAWLLAAAFKRTVDSIKYAEAD